MNSIICLALLFNLLPAVRPFAPTPHSRLRRNQVTGTVTVTVHPWSHNVGSSLTGSQLFEKSKQMTSEEKEVALEKATKAMTAFTNKYLKNTGTKLCSDKSVAAVVVKGLAEHKVSLGSPLCPCRFYEDKVAEAKDGYWNCPCVPMRERHECHCMLFLTEDNSFAGTEQEISFEEVTALNKGIV